MKSSTYLNRAKAAAVAVGLAWLLGSYVPPAPVPVPPPVEWVGLRFRPVALDEERPERDRLGALRFLGGWEIASTNRRFGSLSALHVQGGQVTAVSDAGVVTSFALPGGSSGTARLLTPTQGPGRPNDKVARDSETFVVAGSRAWMAFENSNAVWRYDRGSWRAEAAARPPAMRRWPVNSGAEAMARLPDGRFIVMAEGSGRGGGSSPLLVFDGDPAVAGTRAVELRYRPPEGYRVTDAAMLPDGRLLVLNRRFTLFGGFRAALTTVRLPARLRPGLVLSGTELARFEPPIASDNYEALSVTQEQGRTILWIASDDNFFPLQRTLLLRFELEA